MADARRIVAVVEAVQGAGGSSAAYGHAALIRIIRCGRRGRRRTDRGIVAMEELSIGEILLRLLAALVGGGLLGWEREAQDKPAGLKTHILVALGTCGFTLVSAKLMQNAQGQAELLEADPVRVIQAIATGIGFLGAGAIMRAGGQVRGLTTAASIWVTSAVGVAVGFGFYSMGGGLVAFALITLIVMRSVEGRFDPGEQR